MVDSRLFKVPKGRINKWATNAGLPSDVEVQVTERAENSVSEDAADEDDHSESNTMDSGKSFPSYLTVNIGILTCYFF